MMVILNIALFLAINFIFSQLLKPAYISKFLSLILISLISFILSHFLSFNLSFLISFIIVILICIIRMYNKIRLDLEMEISFLIVFLFFLFLRSLVPDAFGAEKLMDFAFLNSVLNAERFPPNDPFFAGGKLDFYYYFGYVISAVITKISLVDAEIGFNIAMASIPAYSFIIAMGIFRELKVNEYISTILALFSGNLYSVYEFLMDMYLRRLPTFLYYWNSTRIIDDKTYKKVITEFPYFSFIHADLHAHVLAIPLILLLIAVLYKYHKNGELGFLIPILNFSLFITNSWDAPAFIILTSIVVLKKREGKLLLILSVIPIILYSLTLSSNPSVFLTNERANIFQFLAYWGILLPLAYLYFHNEIRLFPHILLFFFLSPFLPAVFLTLPLLIYSIIKRDFVSFLVITAIIYIFLCEFVAIDSRLNTYFKFYLLSWLFLSIPAGVMISRAFEGRYKKIAVIFLAISLIYPTIATPLRHYKADLTLDSSKFLKEWSLGDYNAAIWLRDKKGVIVEAAGDCYTYGGRISAFSAKQTIVAWQCHEVQWRKNANELIKRMNDVRTIYTSKNCSEITKIAKKYEAKYIILGKLEREMYDAKEERFSCLKEVFRSYNTIIYEIE